MQRCHSGSHKRTLTHMLGARLVLGVSGAACHVLSAALTWREKTSPSCPSKVCKALLMLRKSQRRTICGAGVYLGRSG